MTAVSCTHRSLDPEAKRDRETESALESLLTGDTTTHGDHRGTLRRVLEDNESVAVKMADGREPSSSNNKTKANLNI